jgi:hypothetical protein
MYAICQSAEGFAFVQKQIRHWGALNPPTPHFLEGPRYQDIRIHHQQNLL